jgi:hypothetical protein
MIACLVILNEKQAVCFYYINEIIIILFWLILDGESSKKEVM